MPTVIVIGFVGGFISHDNLVHSEVHLASRLRKDYLLGVNIETFENYHGAKDRKKVLDLLDTHHDGILTPEEKRNARIIIYGHSWGGSEAITLARELEKDGIPFGW
jgi:pimeloyl-ACP methyl ester carboxylesterase